MRTLNIRGCRFLLPQTIVDARGTLSVCEAGKHIPFEIKRCFWIHGVPEGEVRGHHAHRDSSQVHVCMSGRAEISLDDGRNREIVTLSSPGEALLVGPLIWHSMKFFDNATFFVFTSNHYDEKDYIRNLLEFMRIAK